jgi:tetratricopeptide (TPR) repeat protein
VSLTSGSTADKFKLIYEFNNRSPLFAYVAADEIEHGNVYEAIKILEAGLLIHPHYSTPYFIMALAQAYSGDEESAIKYAMEGSHITGSEESFNSYEKKIKLIISERNDIPQTKRPTFYEEVPEPVVNKNEDELEILAEKLSKAKINAKAVNNSSEELHLPQFGGKIVSETMAEIFVSQKNYDEAISIYNELMLAKPEKIDFYENRIEEIKIMMT